MTSLHMGILGAGGPKSTQAALPSSAPGLVHLPGGRRLLYFLQAWVCSENKSGFQSTVDGSQSPLSPFSTHSVPRIPNVTLTQLLQASGELLPAPTSHSIEGPGTRGLPVPGTSQTQKFGFPPPLGQMPPVTRKLWLGQKQVEILCCLTGG